MGAIARNVVARRVEARPEPRPRDHRPTARLEAAVSRRLAERPSAPMIAPELEDSGEIEVSREPVRDAIELRVVGSSPRLAHTLRRAEPARPTEHDAVTQQMRVVLSPEIEAEIAAEEAARVALRLARIAADRRERRIWLVVATAALALAIGLLVAAL